MTLSLFNHLAADSAYDARLRKTPKSLPPRWFYDPAGSDLFDQITRLAEYQPTHAAIPARCADLDLGAYHHVACRNAEAERTEMWMQADRRQREGRRGHWNVLWDEPVAQRLPLPGADHADQQREPLVVGHPGLHLARPQGRVAHRAPWVA